MSEKKIVFLISVILVLLAGVALEAQDEAEESGPFTFSGNVTLTSDYVWRGISQSNEDPAIQGGFDVAVGGFYVGTWGSNVDFAETSVDDADLELDVYLGYGFEFGESFGFDIGLINYLYPGTAVELDWLEGYLNFSWRWFGFGINYSSDVFASDTDGLYLVLSYSQELGAGFEIAADVAQYSFDAELSDPDSYMTYSAGVSWSKGPASIGVTYFGTDSDGESIFGDWAGDRVVLSLTASM